MTQKKLKAFSRQISAIANAFVKSVKVTIKWITGDDLGYTGFEGKNKAIICLNSEHELIREEDDGHKLLFLKGVCIHEILHLIFSDFDLLEKTVKKVEGPEEYPNLYKTIFYIFEDCRIESFAPSIFGGMALIALQDTIKTIWEKGEPLEKSKGMAQLLNAMIMYGDLGTLKGHFTDKKAEEVFLKILPYYDDAILSRKCRDCQKNAFAAYKIIKEAYAEELAEEKALSAFLEKLAKKFKSEMKGKGSDASSSFEPSDGKTKSRMKTKKKLTDEMKSGSKGESSDSGDKDSKKSGEKKSSKSKKSDEKDEEGDSGFGESSDTSEKKDKSGSDDADKSGKSGKEDDTSAEKKTSEGSESGESDDKKDGSKDSKTSGDKPTGEETDGDSGDSTDAEMKGGEEPGSGTESGEEAENDSSSEENEYVNSLSGEYVDFGADGESDDSEDIDYNLTDEDIKAAIEEFDKALETAEMLSRKEEEAERADSLEVTGYEKFDSYATYAVRNIKMDASEHYDDLKNVVYSDAIKLAKTVDRIFANRKAGHHPDRRGKVNIVRYKDPNFNSPYIFDTKIKNKEKSAAVMLLIDESGSMGGRKEITARNSAIMLAEAMAAADIPCKIVGFSADEHGRSGEVTLRHYTTFANKAVDRTSLVNSRAHLQNRDGATIEYCAKILKKRPEQNKLMIVISDGCPCADGYYGTQAINDVKEAIRKAKKEVNVFGISLEVYEEDILHKMYGQDYAAVASSSQLAPTLARALTRICKNWMM